MKPHVLVVGGTGMLKEVCLWLVDQGYNVSVIGRTQERLNDVVKQACDSSSISPISVDYRNEEHFLKEIIEIQHKRGPITLAVCWIHSDAPNALRILAETLSNLSPNPWRLFHVRGSTAHLSQVPMPVPERCLYRQIVLGFILSDTSSRWLTNKEIATGIIKAIQRDQVKCVVGTLEPWEKRP
ncbi:short-chain dehydrogenase [Sporosarcina aquimarina]|uniref:short-chain dehydrogenase n=1 Tax=Sporosarcina aquimarina TaxID=114975 RepID=UPI002040D5F4|nr:short-chain dehydrogenase [Sporosarcina aquimarina]